jgi:hypothetical protein
MTMRLCGTAERVLARVMDRLVSEDIKDCECRR